MAILEKLMEKVLKILARFGSAGSSPAEATKILLKGIN